MKHEKKMTALIYAVALILFIFLWCVTGCAPVKVVKKNSERPRYIPTQQTQMK